MTRAKIDRADQVRAERARDVERSLGRRELLRRAGLGSLAAATLATPFVRGLGGRGAAQDMNAPKRLLVFFTPNGTIREEWSPDGGETDFTFRRILAPLERHRDQLLILDGLDMSSTNEGPGDGHQKGMGHVLTGVELLPGDTMGGCDTCPPVSWSGGLSIDQLIAQHLAETTVRRFDSIEAGVLCGDAENVWTRMCYRAPSDPLPPESNPGALFARLFGDPSVDLEATRRRELLRLRVLDHDRRDFERLRVALGREDRERLDRHLALVRSMETRLEASGAVGEHCAAPTLDGMLDWNADANVSQILDAQIDNVTMAFACDLTRVASIQCTNSVGNIRFDAIGLTDRHHDLSHEGDSNAEAIDKIVRINVFYAERFAHLLDRLSSVPEGDEGQTMLDHTLVVWVNELGRGNSHTLNDIPFVLAGNVPDEMGRPTFRTGRVLRFEERTHNDLWTRLAQAFGASVERFGDPRHSGGPLEGLS
ncbi:MAG: DUF1552 domain-containing protein [Deltaproteobacteria bacterium]|nr:DUF1552 domain-containing protein [Deltaproteobacteria bacterium]